MLPAAYRLRSSAEFAAVTRTGRRVRAGDVVVYLTGAADSMRPDPMGSDSMRSTNRQPSDQTPSGTATMAETKSPRAGLIVSRKVGGSVVRHQVSRRLRAQLASRLPALPAGSRLVVRALPSAAGVTSAELAGQLDRALAKLTRPAPAGGTAAAAPSGASR